MIKIGDETTDTGNFKFGIQWTPAPPQTINIKVSDLLAELDRLIELAEAEKAASAQEKGSR